MNNYIKSPLNYTGGKYKLLPQIEPLFPNEINTFVDLFAGGYNVGINVNANKIVANDINTYVIELLSTFKAESTESILKHIKDRIAEYGLSKTNREAFNKLREDYNTKQNPLDLYTLVCYSFNYQFRFNNNMKYNNPFGKNRSHFSASLEKKLVSFAGAIDEQDVWFTSKDFRDVRLNSLNRNDFVYCDPPYLITTGSYNDGNRGFKDWTEKEEKDLLNLLDELNYKGVKFGLSNVFEHKGKKNNILIQWSKKYSVRHLNMNYNNCNYQTNKNIGSDEVYVCNY